MSSANDDSSLRKRHAPSSQEATTRKGGDASSSSKCAEVAPSSASFAPLSNLPRRNLLPFVLLIFIFSVTYFCYYRHLKLPSPRSLDTPLEEFSEARARQHLHHLVSLGPTRTTGGPENEIGAVKYIVKTLRQMQKEIERYNPGLILELDVQRPSGTFDLDFLGGFTSEYQNVTNIVARLSRHPENSFPYPERSPTETALLVSSHFDSALGTRAATDDVANAANMLEALRALTHTQSLPCAVIFLFNGAEETILQAAHGFITSHPWAPSISAFINLEGAGGTGRELVFQTGPKHDWLANAYSASAPYPFASVLGQDIFQSGLIPSDTDFRIFRDFGGIPGMDVAYIGNGFVYHTLLDVESEVSSGALQRAGENLLATTKSLVNSPFLILTHKKYMRECAKVEPGALFIAGLAAKEAEEKEKEKEDARAERKAKGLLEFEDEDHEEIEVETAKPSEPEAKPTGGITGRIAASVDAFFERHASLLLTKRDLERTIAKNHCLNHMNTHNHDAVYFDVVGAFVVIYSPETAKIVNWIAIAVAVLYLLRQSVLAHRDPYAAEHKPKLALAKGIGLEYAHKKDDDLDGDQEPVKVDPLAQKELERVQAAAARAAEKALSWKSRKVFTLHFFATLVCLVAAMLASVSVGATIQFVFRAPMRWFARPWLVIGLYFAPAILVFCELQRAFTRKIVAKWESGKGRKDTPAEELRKAFAREEAAYDSGLCFWVFLLLIFTISELGSSFLALFWVLPTLIARGTAARVEVLRMLDRIRARERAAPPPLESPEPDAPKKDTPLLTTTYDELRFPHGSKGWYFISLSLCGLVLPLILVSQASLVVVEFFLPLMGRSGTFAPSDVVIAGIMGIVVGLAALLAMSFVQLLDNATWRRVRVALAALVVASVLFAARPSLGTPGGEGALVYDATRAPKRVMAAHMERTCFPINHDSFGLSIAGPTEPLRVQEGRVEVIKGAPSQEGDVAVSTALENRALRSSVISGGQRRNESGLWLLAMDILNLAPLRDADVRLPPASLGYTKEQLKQWYESQRGQSAEDVPAEGDSHAVDPSAPAPLFGLGYELRCPSDSTSKRSTLNCDMPYYLPLKEFVKGNWFFPFPPSGNSDGGASGQGPHSLEAFRPQLKLEKVEKLSGPDLRFSRRSRLYFSVTSGATHMTLHINNRPGLTRVLRWSFGSSSGESEALGGVPTLGKLYSKPSEKHQPGGRGPEELFVYFASGMPMVLRNEKERDELLATLPVDKNEFMNLRRNWTFWLDVADEAAFEPAAAQGSQRPFLDFSLISHWLQPEHNRWIEKQILPSFPDWVTPVWWTSLQTSFHFRI